MITPLIRGGRLVDWGGKYGGVDINWLTRRGGSSAQTP